jgi:ketosteroid isomerase-like protein
VIVVLRMRGTGRGSGVTVEERIAHQWRVRDGKAVALQVYSDPEDALRDARANP